MNLNYSIGKTFGLLIDSIVDYTFMKILIICGIILFAILMLNQKYSKYIVSLISVVLIGFIVYYYHSYLFTLSTFKYINHNIRFYFLNSIIFILIISIYYYRKKPSIWVNVFYCLSFILLSFAIFMTGYIHNIELIVLGNIYPMIVYGNYLYFIFYLYVIMTFFIKKFLKK